MRRGAFWLLLAVGLTGCGASTSETPQRSEAALHTAQSAVAPESPQMGVSTARPVYGNGTKGPLIDAMVELYEIDSDGYPSGAALASTQTDAKGDWELSVDSSDALLVRISGGSYVDEADTNVDSRRIVELTADQYLESVLLPGESAAAVTVFSHALVQKSRRETGQGNFTEVLANNRELFTQAYGFDVLAVLPANPLAPSGSLDEIAYAMSVGGVANAINALSIAANSALPEYVHILSVVDDLVDCRLDGLGIGAQQVINPALTAYRQLTLEQQVLRFRNNNYAAYGAYEPLPINASRCDQLGGIADILAPVVVSTADSPVFEAQSPDGVTLSDAQKDALRAQFVATDDRRGELNWSIGIPQQLSLGATPLTAEVGDAWGNRTSVDWQVLVTDTTPPEFDSLDAIIVDAQGDETVIELQRPNVSDRVSAQNQIVVISDAPAAFPVGQTLVLWTALDEAGNAATQNQTVTVNSIPPVATPAPPVINVDPAGIDFSQFFTDPDGTSLTYSITGLPVGTGFSLDPQTGVLTGSATLADLAAQPLQLTVSAFDGQNTASVQTTLDLAPPNTPPVFSLSQVTLILDEDFVDQIVQIQPQEVPPTEADQVVSYSVRFASTEAEAEAPFDVVLDADGLSLTLVARPDASGEAMFDVVANDGQATQAEFVQTLVVSVTPVNDAPVAELEAEPLLLIVGQPFSFDLGTRATDVDDSQLAFSAVRLPAAMSIDASGQLSGMALPADALSGTIPLLVTASDASAESVGFVLTLQITDPDSDGDGVSDYQESLLGFDPLSTDSDGDGFGDSLEARVFIEPGEPVFFVGADGNDAQAGDTPASALATLDELSVRLASLDASQPAVVLLERAAAIGGTLNLSGSGRTVIGNVDFSTLQGAPLTEGLISDPTTLAGGAAASLVAQSCLTCSLLDVRIEGGRGVQVYNSQMTMDHVQIVGATSSSGGALYMSDSQANATRMHFASNRAEQGGAVLLESSSLLNISDAVFDGNSADFSGGAIAVADSELNARNVLFASNAAPVAAVVDALASEVGLDNVTAAYNQVKSLAGTQLFRCRTALTGPCNDATVIRLNDSVVAANRNSGGQPVDLADVDVTGPDVLVEPGRGAGLLAAELASIEPYAVGFSSNDAAVANAGSLTAVAAGLDGYFSQPDSPFTDTDMVEPGVHSRTPYTRIDVYNVDARFTEQGSLFNQRAVDLVITSDAGPVDGQRRVSVEALGTSPRAIAISTGHVPGATNTVAPALNLGNGRYRIWVTNSFNAFQDQLLVRLDDDPVGVTVHPACDLALCQQADPTAAADGIGERPDQLTLPRPATQAAPAARNGGS